MAFSAFPSLPGDTGRTLGSGSGATVGFAGNTVVVKDLFETMRKFQQKSPQFNKEMKKVGAIIAQDLKERVIVEAGTVSRARQAVAVAKGFRVVKSDRLPTLELRGSSPFPSKSRPPSKRKNKSLEVMCSSVRSSVVVLHGRPDSSCGIEVSPATSSGRPCASARTRSPKNT